MYVKYGFYKEALVNLVKKGKLGAEEIQQMMVDYRTNPPVEIGGSKVVTIKDFEAQIEMNLATGTKKAIDLPKSNVLQFFTANGSKISVRPSGTEPKIKFYIGAKAKLCCVEEYAKIEADMELKIKAICTDLGV
jgi:phosphoglucomutase